MSESLKFDSLYEIVNQPIVEGVITSIDSDEDTCQVKIGYQHYSHVPIFFHCTPTSRHRENGAILGASSAFGVGDKVLVMVELERSYDNLLKIKKCSAVIGHSEDRKSCASFLIYSGMLTAYLNYGVTDYETEQYLMPYILRFDRKTNQVVLEYSPIDDYNTFKQDTDPNKIWRPYFPTKDFGSYVPLFDVNMNPIGYLYPTSEKFSIQAPLMGVRPKSLPLYFSNITGESEWWEGRHNNFFGADRKNARSQLSLVYNLWNPSITYDSGHVLTSYNEEVEIIKDYYDNILYTQITKKYVACSIDGLVGGRVQSGGYSILFAATQWDSTRLMPRPARDGFRIKKLELVEKIYPDGASEEEIKEQSETFVFPQRLSYQNNLPLNQNGILSISLENNQITILRQKSTIGYCIDRGFISYTPPSYEYLQRVDTTIQYGSQDSLSYRDYFVETYDINGVLLSSIKIDNSLYEYEDCFDAGVVMCINNNCSIDVLEDTNQRKEIKLTHHRIDRIYINMYASHNSIYLTNLSSTTSMSSFANIIYTTQWYYENYNYPVEKNVIDYSADTITFEFKLRNWCCVTPYYTGNLNKVPPVMKHYFHACSSTKLSWLQEEKTGYADTYKSSIYVNNVLVLDGGEEDFIKTFEDNNKKYVVYGGEARWVWWVNPTAPRNVGPNSPVEDSLPYIGMITAPYRYRIDYHNISSDDYVLVASKAIYVSQDEINPTSDVHAAGEFAILEELAGNTWGSWLFATYHGEGYFYTRFGTIQTTYQIIYQIVINGVVIDIPETQAKLDLVDKASIPFPHVFAVDSDPNLPPARSRMIETDTICTDVIGGKYIDRVHSTFDENYITVIYDVFEAEEFSHTADECYWNCASYPLRTDAKPTQARYMIIFDKKTNQVVFNENVFNYVLKYSGSNEEVSVNPLKAPRLNSLNVI